MVSVAKDERDSVGIFEGERTIEELKRDYWKTIEILSKMGIEEKTLLESQEQYKKLLKQHNSLKTRLEKIIYQI